jgi:hypothetical protein
MDASAKRKLAAGAAAGLAAAGGGAAIAATQFSPKAESDAVISDAAKQLGVQPSALGNALKKALSDRVDAAVAAGRLSKEEGDALKAKIQSGDFPLFGGPRGGSRHFGLFGRLDGAASYLGVTTAGRLTAAQEQSILSDLKSRITDFVNGKFPDRPGLDRDHDFGGRPPGLGL